MAHAEAWGDLSLSEHQRKKLESIFERDFLEQIKQKQGNLNQEKGATAVSNESKWEFIS